MCECGSTSKVISVIEARSQPNLETRIPKHVKYRFDFLQLPSRAPPVSFDSPDPQANFPDSYHL